MLNQSSAGGANDRTRYDALLAEAPTVSQPSGPQNPSLRWFENEQVASEGSQGDSFEWAAANFKELLKQYCNRWILVVGHEVIDSDNDCTELLTRSSSRGISNPLMLWIETPTAAGIDAFSWSW